MYQSVYLYDGTGGGKGAKVTDQNQLKVTTASAIHEAALRGDAFSWNSVSYVPAAGDTILLVNNDSDSRLLVINRIYLYSDVPTAVDIHFPAAATWAGTAVTGVNLNRTSNKVAPAASYTDETGNTQGTICITLHTNEVATDQFSIDFPTGDAIVLGEDDSIGIDLVANAGEEECTIIGYYIDA